MSNLRYWCNPTFRLFLQFLLIFITLVVLTSVAELYIIIIIFNLIIKLLAKNKTIFYKKMLFLK